MHSTFTYTVYNFSPSTNIDVTILTKVLVIRDCILVMLWLSERRADHRRCERDSIGLQQVEILLYIWWIHKLIAGGLEQGKQKIPTSILHGLLQDVAGVDVLIGQQSQGLYLVYRVAVWNE